MEVKRNKITLEFDNIDIDNFVIMLKNHIDSRVRNVDHNYVQRNSPTSIVREIQDLLYVYGDIIKMSSNTSVLMFGVDEDYINNFRNAHGKNKVAMEVTCGRYASEKTKQQL